MNHKKHIVLTQLGSPKSTSVKDVRSYLKEFLNDKRVIDTPRIIWFFILNLFILPFRPKRSSEAYKRIEFCGFFPLIEITKALGRGVQNKLPNYKIHTNFILSKPRLDESLKNFGKEDEVWIFPQFPQYSTTTIGSIEDIISASPLKGKAKIVKSYHQFKGFIDLSVKKIEDHLKRYPVDELVISFHGVPKRYIIEREDDYYKHCFETYFLIKEHLSFNDKNIHITFQSRLGREEWLTPYTDEYCLNLARDKKTIGVYCPSFVVDCLETTDEIGFELREEIENAGGELCFIPCLNNLPEWVESYSDFIHKTVSGQEEGLSYQVAQYHDQIPTLELERKPLEKQSKSAIKIVFFTLFLDLIGFSIIFPMFPALAKYYLEKDPDNYFLNLIFSSITSLTQMGGTQMSSVVLFGGALGAIYSLLQFIAAPLWGSLSDRIGRKPVLLVSIFGLFISYVIWIFSGSFTLLILSRFIGGIMGGNLSTATAVVADVTDESNRSKGMAFVGIAFAFGFIFGPAIGGVLTLFNPLDHFPAGEEYGLNPFSYAAIFAAVLSFINLGMIAFKFKETLKVSKLEKSFKTNNPLKLFKPLPFPNVNRTNIAYFLFISSFSGMEFTLTFLAVERLGYSSMDNAYMFIFIGFIIALVQGGFIRRKAHEIGEKKVAIMGLITLAPGLLLIAFNSSSLILYCGLFFLSVGSAMAIPTLTSLVSIYTPKHEQGRSLGIFRSLGSLGRVVGPIFASLVYWKWGSTIPYILGAAFLIFPILILNKLEAKQKGGLEDNDTID